MNSPHIPSPVVASVVASMAAISLWRAPMTTSVTLGSGAAGYWLGAQKVVTLKPPRSWSDLPPDPLTSEFELMQLRQEIRETSTDVAGLRQELAAAKTKASGDLSGLSSRLTPLESSTSRASSQLQTLQASLQELDQRLSQNLRQLSDQLVPNSRGLKKLETELINIQQKLAAATLELTTKDDGLNRRIEPIETEIRRLSGLLVASKGSTSIAINSSAEAQLSAKLGTLEKQLLNCASKPELQALNVDTHSLAEALQRLDADLRTLSQRANRSEDLAFLEQRICKLSDDNLSLQNALKSLQCELKTLQNGSLSPEKSLAVQELYDRTDTLQNYSAELRQMLAATRMHYSSDFTALDYRLTPLERDRDSVTAQLHELNATQLSYGERLSQLEPLALALSNLREQIQHVSQTNTEPAVDLEPLETTLAQVQQQLGELASQASRDRDFATTKFQKLSNTYKQLDTDLRELSKQMTNLSMSTPATVDLTPLERITQQLTNDLLKIRNELETLTTQTNQIINSKISDKSINNRTRDLDSITILNRLETLQQKIDELEGPPVPLLLWRNQPAPRERTPQRPAEHRVAVFVDGSNLVKSAQDKNFPLDTTRRAQNLINFLSFVKGDFNAYFHGFELNSEVASTLRRIEDIDYKVVKRRGKAGRVVKANMDSYMILEMFQYMASYDTAVLVSGDGDFIPIVHWLRAQGKRVEVLGIHKTVAFGLQDAADHYEPIQATKHLGYRQI